MRLSTENGIAFAVIATIIGAGFASGREVVTFFSCTGWASWVGVALTSAAVGALCAMLAHIARRTGARSFPGLYASAMGSASGEAVQVLHGLTMLLTASVMLTAGGELGALSLPLKNAYPISMAATLALGILLIYREFAPLKYLGTFLAPAVFLYYLFMALDSSPAPVRALNDVGSASLSGNLLGACFLGLLYAALNTALSGSVVASLVRDEVQPRRLGIKIGLLMLALLIPANAALLRAGEAVRNLALPSVVLAARWGTAGFYASIIVMWLSVITTLAAALGSLRAQAESMKLNSRAAVGMTALGAACLAIVGFEPLVKIGYPLLGWICALALMGLVPFIREN